MGSYISIVNDTTDPWQCKVGPDFAALKIAGFIVGGIGAMATVLASAGGTAPIFAAVVAKGTVSVYGVSMTSLAAITAGAASISSTAAVVGGVSGFGMVVAKNLADKLNKDGYHTIAPGASYKWGKKSLSLWQAGTCIKTVIVSETQVRVETLNMRPIFTGATANSNRDHMIKKWLDDKGTEKEDIVAKAGEKRSMEDDEPGTQIVHFYANGTNSYHDE